MFSASLYDPSLSVEQVQQLHARVEPKGAAAKLITTRDHPLRGQVGLFATAKLDPHAIVCTYAGEVVEAAPGVYAVDFGKGLVVTAETVGNEGRFANDHSGIAAEPNSCLASHICPTTGRRMVCLQTTVAVEPGQELLVSYGSGYWDVHKKDASGSTPGQSRRPVWPKGFRYLSGMRYRVRLKLQRKANAFCRMKCVKVEGATLVARRDLVSDQLVGYYAGVISDRPPKPGARAYLLRTADGQEFFVTDCGSEARFIKFAPRGNVVIRKAHHELTGEPLLEIRVKRNTEIRAGTAIKFDEAAPGFVCARCARDKVRKTPTKKRKGRH